MVEPSNTILPRSFNGSGPQFSTLFMGVRFPLGVPLYQLPSLVLCNMLLELSELTSKFVTYGGYVTIEFDTTLKTCTVVEK